MWSPDSDYPRNNNVPLCWCSCPQGTCSVRCSKDHYQPNLTRRELATAFKHASNSLKGDAAPQSFKCPLTLELMTIPENIKRLLWGNNNNRGFGFSCIDPLSVMREEHIEQRYVLSDTLGLMNNPSDRDCLLYTSPRPRDS